MTDLRVGSRGGDRFRPSVGISCYAILGKIFAVLRRATHFRHVIRLAPVHDGKSHASILTRQRHHGFIHPTPRDQAAEPAAEAIRFLAQLRHDGPGAMNQQLPEILIPTFTYFDPP